VLVNAPFSCWLRVFTRRLTAVRAGVIVVSYVTDPAAAEDVSAVAPGHRAPGARAIRVVLADDSYLVREAIAHVLETEPGFDLVATCEDGDALVAAVDAERPDVVLTDIRMPPSGDDEGITVANRLRATHPEVGVVVVSQYADPRYGVALLEGGSERRAYLLKERLHDRAQLTGALLAVADGGSVVDSKVVEALISAQIRDENSPLAALTPRELEILSEIAQGKSNQAIADQLVLSKRAVEKHINAIFLKLDLTRDDDVSRRVKAALIYLSQRSAAEPAA
jgi:DNA-binding NarL/FixJ family response regulator